MAKKTIKVNSDSVAGMSVESKVRNFEFITDEPEEKNGTNQGPTPVEYLLASLGSCICIMTRMMAGKMELEIDSVSTEVEGDIDYSGIANPEKVRPGVGEIRVKVEVKGDLSEDQKRKIVETAENRCPVTDTLKHSVDVSFETNI
ncbi:MAG: OsmC family protein [Candidatus Bipolaricaulota bacterium]